MKRILSILFVLIVTIPLQLRAQNLTVTDFQLLKNSTLANSFGTERYDRNGEKCAIIRVVRPKPGFTFDTGLKPLVHLEEHPGETWLWVSPMLQHLAVAHDTFGKCDYDIPVTVEGGRTYEMRLDIGTGRFVNIRTLPEGGTIFIDEVEVGTSPLYNHYLDMGKHTIRAEKDKYEATQTTVVTRSSRSDFTLEMRDLSHLYGDVVVEVDGRADIFFQGKKVETGRWRTQLKEGTYTVETRLADADAQTTTFTVVAGQENLIKAIAPTRHTGYLQVYTRPRSVRATIDAGTPIDLTERQPVAVGTHQLQVQKKGYVSQNREYRIARYETTTDTIQLERIKYVKPLAFYFGGGYTVGMPTGITGILGTVIQRNDLQLSYTFGTAQSDPVHWYGQNGTWLGTTRYKQSGFAVKYGYQFNLLHTLAITPQVGYAYSSLSADVVDGAASYADNASAQLATVGVKLLLVPVHHLYVFAAPQYGVTVSKSNGFDLLSSHSDIKADGFSATLGLLFNF